jgi:pyruvate/2-oxoglutarate dehydrogenase complex dihydrolipoamide acyltransferase (E2) component
MRTFRPLAPFRGWRRTAVHTWSAPRDPSVYALVELPVGNALAYIERARATTGVRVTLSHLVLRGVALGIRQNPQLNGIVARGRIMLRESIDIFMQVMTEGGSDLSGIKIAHADQKSAVAVAREAQERIDRLRARQDRDVERTKNVLDRLPAPILGPVLRAIAYLIYDLDLDLSRFGIVKDTFGSAMITNVGMLGLEAAFAPLVPFSRTPLVVLVGEVQDRVVAEDGHPVVRPMLTLGVTFDHRFMDGFQGGKMAALMRAYVQNPGAFDPLPAAPEVGEPTTPIQ